MAESKFLKFINEVKDIEDSGLKGKEFEKTFVKALKLVGLEFEANVSTGPGWDIKPKSGNWNRILDDADVNIKVFGTKWMFSSKEIYDLLPWDGVSEDFNFDLYQKRIKRIFRKKGLNDIVFLKPKSKEIQEKIIEATKNKDVETLDDLMTIKNFYAEKLGNSFDVRILTRGNKITSIAIDKKNKVFMRSDPPRKIKGSITLAFKAPTPKLGKVNRKVKVE